MNTTQNNKVINKQTNNWKHRLTLVYMQNCRR